MSRHPTEWMQQEKDPLDEFILYLHQIMPNISDEESYIQLYKTYESLINTHNDTTNQDNPVEYPDFSQVRISIHKKSKHFYLNYSLRTFILW